MHSRVSFDKEVALSVVGGYLIIELNRALYLQVFKQAQPLQRNRAMLRII